jgi:ankyrin repeat protein
MGASYNGHHDIVRTLLEGGGDVNAQSKVRNQMMMMIILLTILMMMMMMMMIVINDEDRVDCR